MNLFDLIKLYLEEHHPRVRVFNKRTFVDDLPKSRKYLKVIIRMPKEGTPEKHILCGGLYETIPERQYTPVFEEYMVEPVDPEDPNLFKIIDGWITEPDLRPTTLLKSYYNDHV